MDKPISEYADRLEGLLDGLGVALTMGGEPTFVSAFPEGAEWNTAAMGEEKLGYARRMTAKLIEAVYPGALAMQVFGKWYPGEPLPRWNVLTLHGKEAPLWPETERLLLDDRGGGNDPAAAEELARALAGAFGLAERLIPAAEREEDPKPSGWVLPLSYSEGAWVSADWPFSAGNPVPLFAGDSPVGLRLPLYRLEEGCLRTAMTVELRRGALEVFVPPLEWTGFEAFVAAVRAAVLKLGLRDLVFCGYGPSETKGRVESLGLAADPGVLEVNLPPTASWKAYDLILKQCAEAADAVDLKLTKFALNGIVYGTGGGAHLAFGGPDRERNPFLEKPERIASILRYWQHHPALSYLFSGQYVGPGSQAPRVDEGPSHGLYELEVACEGLERQSYRPDGERIDQFLKNLLTDSSGNTHRAEICFDKFHNYAQPNGLLGIVELRAFETYGEVETMSRVALLVRSIFARLFKEPFRAPLRRFGPALHDRYFLPSFLWEDCLAICADLKAHGLAFDPDWLRPVLDFRCPEVGRIDLGEGAVVVRRAFESWPLMAEESRGAATVRVVDNSTDRLELRLSDRALLEKGRLLVNRVELPFEEVGGEWIGGLRYKCASAYPALHPHVPIQAPLEFEWVDRRSGTTTHAARYHYWHPTMPVYEGRPRDAEEAAKRRAARWLGADELVGRRPDIRAAKRAPEYRHTLDLRRQG